MAGKGSVLAAGVNRRLRRVGYLANGMGGVIALAYTGVVALPAHGASTIVRNVVVFAIYAAITLPAGHVLIHRSLYRPVARWLASNEAAGPPEQVAVLGLPARWALRVLVPWLGALPLFVLLNLAVGARLLVSLSAAIVLGTIMAAALQYLLVEQAMRPVTARALGSVAPTADATPGVVGRLIMAWTLGAGIPLAGIVAVAATASLGHGLSRDRVAAACGVLAVIGIVAGTLAIRLTSRSVTIPLRGLRDGLAAVEAGRLELSIPVDDGSEVGRLQAGFNSMIAGLREREQLREAFGSYVDPDLTKRILHEGVDLAGEEIELSVMFIDVRGFTSFAETTTPKHVLARLNALYSVVVPIITANGGHASKFIGDGLLAVFGAPQRLADHADRAVGCALEIIDTTQADADRYLPIGIGINTGTVVAGTLGGGGRRDFTVIGDTVNTAARVESATRRTGDDLLITESTRKLLADADGWEPRPSVQLKGKSGTSILFAPAKHRR